MSKTTELRKLSLEKLQSKLTDARKEVQKITLEQSTDPSDNVRTKRNLKKDIARMLTVINEKQGEN